MQTTSTYTRTEKITRISISTPLVTHLDSQDQHDVRVIMREGRNLVVPKSGAYRIHPSGVLEITLEAVTMYFAQGTWTEVKDTNTTKYLKHFQEMANKSNSETP